MNDALHVVLVFNLEKLYSDENLFKSNETNKLLFNFVQIRSNSISKFRF